MISIFFSRRFLALLIVSGATLIFVSFLLISQNETKLHLNFRPGAGSAIEHEARPSPATEDPRPEVDDSNGDLLPTATFLHGTLKGTVTAILYSISSKKETQTPISTALSLPAQASPTVAAHDTPKLRIAITETGGSHDEVVAALVHAFGSQKDVELSLYMLLKRYKIDEVIRSFGQDTIKSPIKSSFDFPEQFSETNFPHIVVSATCELDLFGGTVKHGLQYLLEKGQTYLFCVVHHADRWAQQKEEEAIKPWIEKQKVTILTLSPHTADYFRKTGMSGWHTDAEPIVRYFIPVFPAPLPAANATEQEDGLAFALQGDFDPGRRDYGTIFKEFEQFLSPKSGNEVEAGISHQLDVADAANVTLHILGHGDKPSVPETVARHVQFDEGLSYPQYYSLLSRTFALVPAFANSEYLDRKASSSVPAALIGGSPLVASQEILRSYSYLPRDAVWGAGRR